MFPREVVAVMQQDAMNRLDRRQLLLKPRIMRPAQADVHLVTILLSLGHVMPAKAKATARKAVAKVMRELAQKLAQPLRQAVQGALNRAVRNPRPRYHAISWVGAWVFG